MTDMFLNLFKKRKAKNVALYIYFYYSLFSPPCQNNPKTQLRVNSSSFMLAQYTHKVSLVLVFMIKHLRADLIKDNAHTLKVTLKY